MHGGTTAVMEKIEKNECLVLKQKSNPQTDGFRGNK